MTGVRQLPAAALGIWLMAAPSVLGYRGAGADNDRIVGPVVASIALVAMAEAVRGLRLVNLATGAWLVVAAFVLPYPSDGTLNAVAVGAAVAVAALPGGWTHQRYGGGWRSLRDPRTSARRRRADRAVTPPDGRG